MELLKIRLQSQYHSVSILHPNQKTSKPLYSGPIDCAQQLIKNYGWRNGLFRGYWATVYREIPVSE